MGCGVVRNEILENNGVYGKKAIALGLGLERLVMVFCEITDIRVLWSKHERFLSQYSNGELKKFTPYSKLPCVTKDISFYIPENWTDENTLFELLREHELVQEAKLIDEYFNEKLQKHSRTYRLVFTPSHPELKDPAQFTLLVNVTMNNIACQFARLVMTKPSYWFIWR